METNRLKRFASEARNILMSGVKQRLTALGFQTDGSLSTKLPELMGGGSVFMGEVQSEDFYHKWMSLYHRIQTHSYREVAEEAAYTWFNRLIAIRFMEVNDYLPSHIRVLSSESGKLEPDLVTTPFDAELPFTAEEEAQIFQLKQDNKLDEVFRILFLKQCNALNEILPALFEKTKNYTELLLSLSVIDQDGVVYHLIHDIPEDDFNIERGGQVEIIGWLYQYYNTEPKAAAFAKNGKITKEEIPAVTQLFTPDWIVRYMVENSLGRLWVEGHPDCDLKENWKYYLEEAQQEPEVQAKLSEIRKEYAALNPEDIKLIDPCMGSGHILVYAFDVLMQIYESAGYSQRDAAKSILEHNIYGLDIDDRAYQLAYFAVMMKARQYNRRILNGENSCHVYAIQESNRINRAHLKYFGAGMDDIEKNAAKMQLEGLLDTLTDAKEYGSILNVESYNWDLLRQFVAAEDTAGQISMDSVGVEDTAEQLNRLINIGETMARKYWITVTNPPYAGANKLDGKLNTFIKEQYPNSKADMSTVFMEKTMDMLLQNGMMSMINIPVWMFLPTYEKLRQILLSEDCILSLIHPGRGIFGSDFGTTAFVICKKCMSNYTGIYYRLYKKQGDVETSEVREQAFLAGESVFCAQQSQFSIIPGQPIAYSTSHNMLKTFAAKKIGDIEYPKQGLSTADNERFLRLWYEIDQLKFASNCSSNENSIASCAKWFPFNKGGDFRKWYGNFDYVINWENGGYELRNFKNAAIRNPNYYFEPHVTWSKVSISKVAFRYRPVGSVFSDAGCAATFHDDVLWYALGLLNTKYAQRVFDIINPTVNYTQSTIANLPYIVNAAKKEIITETVKKNVFVTQNDWDSFETSWDFKKHPLLRNVSTISEAFNQWQKECDDRFNQLKANEEELNRIFIDIYGLQDELTPEVEDKDVTVRKADLQRDIKSLLSYAVGCMFGRYSIYKDGLIFAGEPYSLQAFADKLNDRPGTISADELERAYRNEGVVVDEMFFPDADNVIPITDEEYLDDDIVSRLCDWLKVVYGADTLEANLDYIAKALGNKGSTSREIIRNYFLNDFFKDHCQTYSVTGSGKRPIYWLFDSGKQNGFKALVYLHRYTPDTIGNLRIDYLHKMQRVYESEINRMQDMMDHSENAREVAAASKRKDKLAKQLKECREYDEKISHLALSRIELDLDDGVKVNYRKLQTAQDGKFYEVLADSKNIMVKEKK